MNPLNDPASALLLIGTLITLGYVASCAVWPFKPCRRCDGRGYFRSPFSRALRHCPRCDGTGLRLRAGRKALNTYRRLNRAQRGDRQQRPGRTHDRDR